MDITVEQLTDVSIYVEHIYQGDLPSQYLLLSKSVPWQDWMQTWLQYLSSSTQLIPDCELSLRLNSDRQIQALNHQYRSINQPTDVLAFAATESDILIPQDIGEPLYLGDIVISLDTALKQATAQNHPLIKELAWLSSHGLLHLIGWDHPDELSLQQMLNKQEELVNLLNF